MKAKPNIFQSALKHKQISIVITFMLVCFGIYALINMPRQEFPEFTIREGLIIGVFPGASSAQVEERLTTKVENYLFGFDEVNRKKTSSISKEGVMIITVTLHDKVHDSDAFWTKFRHGLNELKSQLPPEVLALTATNDFGNTSAILLTISAQNKTYKELHAYLDELEKELRKIESISKLKHMGEIEEQISIYIQDEKLVYYGVKPLTIMAALKTEGTVSYAGDMDNGHLIMPVHVPPRYQTENDIAEQIIYADPAGNVIRLKDVARIVREYKEPDSMVRANGTKCLILSLEMQYGKNIVTFGEEVDAVLKRVSQKFSSDVHIGRIADMPIVVKASVGNFLKELGIAILAVILVTMLLLPFRVAAVSALTIPISTLITIGIIHAFGVELHTVSLAALIIVLGMGVDDAIVVVDNHIEKLDNGENVWDAAWKSSSELFIPVFTASLAIISAFVPFAFVLTGMAGDFMRPLPITITVALWVSMLVAQFFVPYLNFVFIKTGLNKKKDEKAAFSFLNSTQKLYDKYLDKSLKRPGLTVIIGVLSLLVGILLAIQLPQQLFPKVIRNQFAVEIYLPEGKSLEETDRVTKKVEETLQKDKRVKDVTAFIGTSSPRFHTTYAPNFPSKNYAQLIVNTISEETTIELLDEYHDKLSEYFPNAHIRMKQLDMMASKAPLEIRISGNNISDIKKVSLQVTALMRKDPGVIWVRDDFEQARQGIKLNINEDEANRLGFTKGMIATSLAVGLKGLPVATVWEGDYAVDVVLKRKKTKPDTLDDITGQYVSSLFLPVTVPLRQLASVSPEWTEGQIVRRNGKRTLTVYGDVKRTMWASDSFTRLRAKLDKMSLPEGVTFDFGGEYEAQMENYTSMTYSLLTSIGLIFIILLFQFKGVRMSLLVMSTMPLGLLGAAAGLVAMGFPFGFTAFGGLISLCGMVVRSGIIFIDYAETLRRKQNLSMHEIAAAAGKRRMRPIFLTSTAAAVGVIPMILSGSPLWGPMGTVICFGLMTSMLLGIFVQPAAYLLLVKSKSYQEGEKE